MAQKRKAEKPVKASASTSAREAAPRARTRPTPTAERSEEEQKYRFLVESTGTGYVILDDLGRAVDANPEYVRLTGRAKLEDILGHQVTEWTASHDLERNAAEVAKCLQTGSVRNLVIDYVGPDGGTTPVEINATVLPGPPARIFSVCRDIAARRQAERSLRESEDRLRALSSASFEAIFISEKGICLEQNETAERMFGYTRDEAVGRPGTDWITPQDRDLARRNMLAGVETPYQVTALRKDGSTFPCEIQGRMFDYQGRRVRITALRDIADRTRAERRQLEFQDQLAALSASLADGMVYQINSGSDGTRREFSYISPAVERLHGLKADAVRRDPLLLYGQVLEEDRPKLSAAEAQALATKTKLEVDVRVRVPSGEVYWRRFISTPRIGPQGEWLWDGIEFDITERKHAEDALRESESRLRTVTENAPDTILQVDRNGTILFVNRPVPGLTAEQIIGTDVCRWVPPESQPVVRHALEQVFATGRRQEYETSGPAPNGEVRFYSVRVVPVASGGRAGSAIYIATDITERRLSEQVLRASEARTRSIIESIPVGMHIYRRESGDRLVFTGANPAADRILGVDNRSFVGKTIEEAFPSLANSEVPRRYRDVVATGQPWQRESIAYEGGGIKGAFEVHAFRTGPDTMVAAFQEITERKRAELALKESEAKYRRLYNETPVMLHSIDRNGVLVDVNDHWLKVMGFERDEVLGRPVIDFYTSASARFGREVVQPAFFRDGFVRDVSYQFVKKNGQVIDVLLSSTGERDASGAVVRSQSVIEDVTERKRAEAALRASESRYRQLYEGTPVMMHSINVEGILVSVSDHWLRTLGYTREEVLGRRSTEFLDEPSRVYASTVVLPEFMRTGVCTDVPYTFLKKNGEPVMTLLSAIAERDEAGKVVRSLAVIVDVTDRKRAEERLRESEEQYRQLFDAESDAIFLIDNASGSILAANDAASTLYGYSVEELLKMKNTDLSAEPSETRRVTEETPVVKDNAVRIALRYHRKKDGTVIPVEITGRFFTYQGRPVHIAAIRDITERLQAQETLQKSEQMLRAIIDTGPDCIELTDRESRVALMNRAGLAMVQADSPDQVQGQLFCRLVAPEDRGAFMALTEKVFLGGSGTLEFRLTGLKGRPLWLETFAVPMRSASGEITALLGLTRDITKRKRAEAEVRLNEARMASLYRISQRSVGDEQAFLDFALHEAIALTSSEIGYLYFYDEAKREFTLNSYSRDVMQRCAIAEVKTCYELDRTGVWGEAVRQRKPILLNDFEADHPLKKGYPEGHAKIRKFLTVPVIMQDAVVAVVGVANKTEDYYDADILQLNLLMDSVWKMVQRSRAERALAESEQRFRDLAESLPLTVFETDLQGSFTYVNRAVLSTFGYTKEDIETGLHFSQVIAPEDRDRTVAVFTRRMTGHLDGYMEYRGLRKDGSTFPISVASGPVLREGRPAGLRGIVTDLSQQKALEEERRKTDKLESIGTLAGGIAHDFNNLLQGVFGYISMARLTLDEREKALAMLGQAEQALHRTVGLTNQLLTFSKGGKPVKQVLRLPPIIESTITFALSGSRVGYKLEIDPDLRPVEADEAQIGQALQNIILNAEQAMPLGGTLKIRARNSVGRAGFVEVSVRDSGVGIPPENLPRLFDPYFTTKEGGSGLGLATSFSILKNHGGEIVVESEPGRGSTFTLFLPASEREPAGEEPPSPPSEVRPARVLLMDDEEFIRKVGMELLQSLGHEVEVAAHGSEAVERYRNARAAGRPFDVVILDLTIRGGMGGVETMMMLRQIDPGVRAIMSSGYSDDEATSKYRELGFVAFLKKPYARTGLRTALNGLLLPVSKDKS